MPYKMLTIPSENQNWIASKSSYKFPFHLLIQAKLWTHAIILLMKIEAPGSSLNGSTKIFVFKYLKISDVHVNCPGGGGGGYSDIFIHR